MRYKQVSGWIFSKLHKNVTKSVCDALWWNSPSRPTTALSRIKEYLNKWTLVHQKIVTKVLIKRNVQSLKTPNLVKNTAMSGTVDALIWTLRPLCQFLCVCTCVVHICTNTWPWDHHVQFVYRELLWALAGSFNLNTVVLWSPPQKMQRMAFFHALRTCKLQSDFRVVHCVTLHKHHNRLKR